MECAPSVSAEVVTAAWPAASSAAETRDVHPSWKATVPVGVPPTEDATVAVKVTDWPSVEGFNEEARTVVVAALPTMLTEEAALLLPPTGSGRAEETPDVDAWTPAEPPLTTIPRSARAPRESAPTAQVTTPAENEHPDGAE